MRIAIHAELLIIDRLGANGGRRSVGRHCKDLVWVFPRCRKPRWGDGRVLLSLMGPIHHWIGGILSRFDNV
ncbi:hypothetical protein MAIT1_03790 [Magnetofaba australis IT-1]|uniref:Uncharacterized protein n=1 Tax=Magnetofaba australis IT-1 TaxID=1434232 RepID=A0A1Y2K4N8_9PROT|nr:hypothetical protein MAIT1_03790 [Magnetofaba australis IT-1]